MNSGEDIFFLDLSQDPELFSGPKGDKQVRNITKCFSFIVVLWFYYASKWFLQCSAVWYLSKDEKGNGRSMGRKVWVIRLAILIHWL